MYSELEIREDMDKLRSHIDALRNKYEGDFSCVLSTGVAIDDAWAGSCLICGKDQFIHQACHGLLENPKFIDEFFDAVKCVMVRVDKPEFMKILMKESMDSLKRLLIAQTKSFKDYKAEEDADKAVQDLLEQAGFTN